MCKTPLLVVDARHLTCVCVTVECPIDLSVCPGITVFHQLLFSIQEVLSTHILKSRSLMYGKNCFWLDEILRLFYE